MMKKIIKRLKNSRLIQLLLACLVLFILTLFYFFYNQFRQAQYLYVFGPVLKNINYPDTPYYYAPYWVNDVIRVNDRDLSPFGSANAVIVDKEFVPGNYLTLLVKVRTIKDRSGHFLFRNKPLAVGSVLELRFPKTNVNMVVLSLDNKSPKFKYKMLVLDTIFKEIDPWRTEMVSEGSLIKNNKGMIVAKFISKKIRIAEVSGQNDRGQRVVTADLLKRDMDVRIEILVKEIDGEYYFQDLSKVKANQSVFIPWNEGDLNHFIRSIVEVKDVGNQF